MKNWSVHVPLVEEIRQAKNAQPFRPFSLKLADGTTYAVKHPEYILVLRSPSAGSDLLHARRR